MATHTKSKDQLVADHLKRYRSINVFQAIDLYQATRLSAIIFTLKKDKRWVIATIRERVVDSKGRKVNCVRYRLVSTPAVEPIVKIKKSVKKSKKASL